MLEKKDLKGLAGYHHRKINTVTRSLLQSTNYPVSLPVNILPLGKLFFLLLGRMGGEGGGGVAVELDLGKDTMGCI